MCSQYIRCRRKTVEVEITHGNRIFIAVSAYLDNGKDIIVDLKIKKIIQLAKGKGLVVAIDSNARSKTWHDVITNKRGFIYLSSIQPIRVPAHQIKFL